MSQRNNGNGLRLTATWTGNLIGTYVRVVWAMVQIPLRLLSPGENGDQNGGGGSSQQQRLSGFILRIQKLVRVARSEGLSEDFLSALNRLADRREEMERAVIVWVSLVEVLVQDAERRYGSTSGLGALKAADVKATFSLLLRRQHFKFPGVPDLLMPILTDVVIGWVVDALVQVLNHYGLWIDTSSQSPKLTARLAILIRRAWRWFVKIVWRLLSPILAFAIRVYDALRQKTYLSAELQKALEDVEKEGLLQKNDQFFQFIFGVVEWFTNHRESLLALIEIVSEAVQEAETFASLPGKEKKAYARDLVLAVLDALGFKQRFGLMYSFIEVIIECSIETAVYLFNRHNVFTHSSPA